MKTSGNTVLITGGATGIGLALAGEFVKAGNRVIICSRRREKLEEAKRKIPQLSIKVCDVSKEEDREELFSWVKLNFPEINILINNAGIQIMRDLRTGHNDLEKGEDEIDINLKAPIILSELFIPVFLKRDSAIINVTSGLAFVPLSSTPIYCATKAALHSFTVSLRQQLKDTSIKVFEIIPPMVDTELGGRRRQPHMGIPASELSSETINLLKKDIFEIPVGMAKGLRDAGRGSGFEENFKRMNN
jgi:uncharacterized oxidoreductase